jgi:hypothetical protein
MMAKGKTSAPAIKPPGKAKRATVELAPLERLRRALDLSAGVPADVVQREAADYIEHQRAKEVIGGAEAHVAALEREIALLRADAAVLNEQLLAAGGVVEAEPRTFSSAGMATIEG